MSVNVLFKEVGSIKVSCIMVLTQEISENLRKKKLLFLVRLEKVRKPFLKSLDSKYPQSDGWFTNGGNLRECKNIATLADQQLSLCLLPVAGSH